MPDYIPGADPSFDAWQANFVSVVNGNLAGYGLVAGDMTPITTAQTAWNSSFPAHQTAQAAAQAAKQTKDADRTGLETAVRTVVRKIQATPSVTGTAKAAAGITVPDTEPTPSGPPITAPVGQVDTSQRLQHTVSFSDAATPTSKAKPPGVRGCEIWMKVGTPPPVTAADLTFVTLDTRTPHDPLRWGRRQQDRHLLAPLGQHPRRDGAVERGGQRDGAGVVTCHLSLVIGHLHFLTNDK